MDRRQKILADIDTAKAQGVEIGALFNPIALRAEGPVVYVDHETTEGLRNKYRNDPQVDINALVDVDAVWGNRTLREAIGGTQRFDYIVASHVIEHVPDLISWLGELREVLADNGSIRLAIPDRRYTFDYLRRESTLVDVVHARTLRTRIPLAYHILDQCLNGVHVDPTQAWAGPLDPSTLKHSHSLEGAMHVARDAVENGVYHDVHCWVFTPRTFAGLFAEMVGLGLTDFACGGFFDTDLNQIEFFVHLVPSKDRQAAVASWQKMAHEARQ